jgi:hypothetical protein
MCFQMASALQLISYRTAGARELQCALVASLPRPYRRLRPNTSNQLVAPGPVLGKIPKKGGAFEEEDVWTRCVTNSIDMVSN